MRRRIFRNNILLAAFAVIFSSLLVTIGVYNHFMEQMSERVRSEAAVIAAGLPSDDKTYLQRAAFASVQTRLTLIGKDGDVIYDSQSKQESMENHADRPEVKSAFELGRGESRRLSETLGSNTYYYAIRLSNGQVLRIAETTRSVFAELGAMLPFILICLLGSILLAAVISKKQADSIVAPINDIDLEKPMEADTYDELAPFLNRIEHQRKQIEAQIDDSLAKQHEFAQISENMREGLILLSASGRVMTINKSAQKMLSCSDCTGKHVITISRDESIQQAARQALLGEAVRLELEKEGRCYRILASPVIQNGIPAGAVLLMPDITDLHRGEVMRREFTANVSHELKTPLTSISGYAELMKNGMARPEDMQRFSERIYEESARLIELVSDIISLSQLEEKGVKFDASLLDLAQLAENAMRNVAPMAELYGIELKCDVKKTEIIGSAPLLERMLSCLCENAVKYNRPGGYVRISVCELDGRAQIALSDNGIGIAREHHERIFERFYRVDKSHSKETGGTGLGLSIVKHIVLQHGGEISLESELGKGTCITAII